MAGAVQNTSSDYLFRMIEIQYNQKFIHCFTGAGEFFYG
jgi:hypothetical protein